MKRILTIAFISFLYVAQAQERETRKITAPDAISSATSLRVDYIHSNRNEVVVEADNPEHLPLIETTVKNGTLYVQYKRNTQIRNARNNRVTVYSSKIPTRFSASSSSSIHTDETIKANKISVDVSSSASISLKKLIADDISLSTSSSSKLTTEVSSKNLQVAASSSSKQEIAGSASNLNLNTNSSASVDMSRFTTTNAQVQANSSANVTLSVKENLQGNVSTSARIALKNQPKNVQVDKSTSGRVVM
ncbi:GIN domain-containing protein [Sphingobacterium sp.]|uniref:GIN domain-containing protein n=1 Tax=Sphingobacterium sp. TaxID=341027 RepID=UPI002FDE8E19